MVNLLKTSGCLAAALFFAGALSAAPPTNRLARPGMVNYTEGQVTVNGHAIGARQLGSVEVGPGQVLQTGHGKAEMLLTPGVFLRLNDESAVKMISPSLTKTQVELLKGEALVEADQVEKENDLQVLDHGIETQMVKNGLYDFRADQPRVAVYDGKARVLREDRSIDVGKGKELSLVQNAPRKPQGFDRHQTDGLYAWSKLRSQYLSEVNASSAQMLVVNNPGWWYGPGWFWNPWYSSWAFVPAYDYFFSPFGFGLYSPAYWSYYPPVYYHGRPRIAVGRPPVAHFGAAGRRR